jgi:hypothetical protein
LGDARRLAEWKASKKINILLSGDIFRKLVPESTETLESAKDKIEVSFLPYSKPVRFSFRCGSILL